MDLQRRMEWILCWWKISKCFTALISFPNLVAFNCSRDLNVEFPLTTQKIMKSIMHWALFIKAHEKWSCPENNFVFTHRKPINLKQRLILISWFSTKANAISKLNICVAVYLILKLFSLFNQKKDIFEKQIFSNNIFFNNNCCYKYYFVLLHKLRSLWPSYLTYNTEHHQTATFANYEISSIKFGVNYQRPKVLSAVSNGTWFLGKFNYGIIFNS